MEVTIQNFGVKQHVRTRLSKSDKTLIVPQNGFALMLGDGDDLW
jgi:hypothetical protein